MYKYVQNELRLPNMLREGSVTRVHVHTDTAIQSSQVVHDQFIVDIKICTGGNIVNL